MLGFEPPRQPAPSPAGCHAQALATRVALAYKSPRQEDLRLQTIQRKAKLLVAEAGVAPEEAPELQVRRRNENLIWTDEH